MCFTLLCLILSICVCINFLNMIPMCAFLVWFMTCSEKAMATHSSTLAWKIPWTEETGRLQSMGLQRVRHDWSDLATAAARHVVIVQSLSHVWLFVTQWTAVCQAYLSFTISQSLLKFMSIELVILSNQLILYCPLLLLSSNLSQHQDLFQWPGSFPMSQLFTSGGQSIGTSTSVLPVDKKGWFPLLTNLVSFLSKGLSRVFCNTTVQRHQFFGAQPSLRSNSYNSILGLTSC